MGLVEDPEVQLPAVGQFHPCLEVQYMGNPWLLGIQVMVGQVSDSLHLVSDSYIIIFLNIFIYQKCFIGALSSRSSRNDGHKVAIGGSAWEGASRTAFQACLLDGAMSMASGWS
jgi:hypothetical protein